MSHSIVKEVNVASTLYTGRCVWMIKFLTQWRKA